MSSLLITLGCGYVLLFVVLRFGFGRAMSRSTVGSGVPDLSVVVPAKNESQSIVKCLASIARCEYPGEVEVIAVDSNSSDNTAAKIAAFCHSPEAAGRFRLVHASEGSNKLRALFEGIELSDGQIILTTDSDCVVGSDWLTQMARTFSDNTGVVAGPVVYSGEDGTFFEKIQTMEFAGLVGIGAATLGLGSPSICNSANLAYRRGVFDHFRDLFTDSNFAGADETMLQLCQKELGMEVRFCASRESAVYTSPVGSLREFFAQRIRWASGPVNFPSWPMILLSVTIFGFYFCLLVGPFLAVNGILSISALLWAFGLKAIGDAVFLTGPLEYFRLSRLMKLFIPFELLHVPYVIVAATVGTIKGLVKMGIRV